MRRREIEAAWLGAKLKAGACRTICRRLKQTHAIPYGDLYFCPQLSVFLKCCLTFPSTRFRLECCLFLLPLFAAPLLLKPCYFQVADDKVSITGWFPILSCIQSWSAACFVACSVSLVCRPPLKSLLNQETDDKVGVTAWLSKFQWIQIRHCTARDTT